MTENSEKEIEPILDIVIHELTKKADLGADPIQKKREFLKEALGMGSASEKELIKNYNICKLKDKMMVELGQQTRLEDHQFQMLLAELDGKENAQQSKLLYLIKCLHNTFYSQQPAAKMKGLKELILQLSDPANEEKNSPIFQELLREARDSERDTILHKTADSADKELIQTLSRIYQDHPEEFNKLNSSGKDPIRIACMHQNIKFLEAIVEDRRNESVFDSMNTMIQYHDNVTARYLLRKFIQYEEDFLDNNADSLFKVFDVFYNHQMEEWLKSTYPETDLEQFKTQIYQFVEISNAEGLENILKTAKRRQLEYFYQLSDVSDVIAAVVMRNQPVLMNTLLKYCPENLKQAVLTKLELLYVAICLDHEQIVQDLINAWPDKNKKSYVDVTVKNSHILFDAISHLNDKVVSMLINACDNDKWSYINRQDQNGNTTLQQAIRTKNQNIVLALLNACSMPSQKGIFILERFNTGGNALHLAIETDGIEMFQILMRNLPENEKRTALMIPNAQGLTPIDLLILHHQYDIALEMVDSQQRSNQKFNFYSVLHDASISLVKNAGMDHGDILLDENGMNQGGARPNIFKDLLHYHAYSEKQQRVQQLILCIAKNMTHLSNSFPAFKALLAINKLLRDGSDEIALAELTTNMKQIKSTFPELEKCLKELSDVIPSTKRNISEQERAAKSMILTELRRYPGNSNNLFTILFYSQTNQTNMNLAKSIARKLMQTDPELTLKEVIDDHIGHRPLSRGYLEAGNDLTIDDPQLNRIIRLAKHTITELDNLTINKSFSNKS
jgi:ankyrin repeat protein